MPRTALYFNEEDTEEDFFRASVNPHTQKEVSSADLLKEVRLTRVVGMGTFGIACLCRFRNCDWVVKLPRGLTNPDGWRDSSTLEQVMTVPVEPNKRLLALKDFADECRNAEAVLDAPEVHELRARGRDAESMLGKPLEGLSDQEYAAVCEARRLWRSHPGYEHMHPVVHYDPMIPLLLSLPAEGNLCEKRVLLYPDASEIPREWLEMAWQISEAIEFLRTYPQMAHADIKPANVLFTYRDDRVHCWLSDYGDLYPKRDWPSTIYVGTEKYVPEEHERIQLMYFPDATYEKLSLFEYYATLADLFMVGANVELGDLNCVSVVSYGEHTIAQVVRGMLSPGGFHRTIKPLADFFKRQPALMAHVVEGLDVEHFMSLPERFDETRAWLREQLKAEEEASTMMPRFARMGLRR